MPLLKPHLGGYKLVVGVVLHSLGGSVAVELFLGGSRVSWVASVAVCVALARFDLGWRANSCRLEVIWGRVRLCRE